MNYFRQNGKLFPKIGKFGLAGPCIARKAEDLRAAGTPPLANGTQCPLLLLGPFYFAFGFRKAFSAGALSTRRAHAASASAVVRQILRGLIERESRPGACH